MYNNLFPFILWVITSVITPTPTIDPDQWVRFSHQKDILVGQSSTHASNYIVSFEMATYCRNLPDNETDLKIYDVLVDNYYTLTDTITLSETKHYDGSMSMYNNGDAKTVSYTLSVPANTAMLQVKLSSRLVITGAGHACQIYYRNPQITPTLTIDLTQWQRITPYSRLAVTHEGQSKQYTVTFDAWVTCTSLASRREWPTIIVTNLYPTQPMSEWHTPMPLFEDWIPQVAREKFAHTGKPGLNQLSYHLTIPPDEFAAWVQVQMELDDFIEPQRCEAYYNNVKILPRSLIYLPLIRR